jgi:hypothetical protein
MPDQDTPPASGSNLDYQQLVSLFIQVATATSQGKAPPDAHDDPVALQADYQSTVEVIKLLSDIRFRCLVFVTTVIALVNALVPGVGNHGTRITVGFVGFFTTLGIAVYELRNSQFYESAIHRAKVLERRLKRIKSGGISNQGGLFNERPPYVEKEYGESLSYQPDETELKGKWMRFLFVRVKHDVGLALIYGAVLGGWVYIFVEGVLSIPAPVDYWRPAPPGLIEVIAGVIGFAVFVLATREFIYHDESRYRLTEPAESNRGKAGLIELGHSSGPNLKWWKNPNLWVCRKMRGGSD